MQPETLEAVSSQLSRQTSSGANQTEEMSICNQRTGPTPSFFITISSCLARGRGAGDGPEANQITNAKYHSCHRRSRLHRVQLYPAANAGRICLDHKSGQTDVCGERAQSEERRIECSI